MNFRSYNEVKGADRSDLLGQVMAQRDRVARRLRTIDRVVAVMSGKGGVGKSYVTAAIARALAENQGLAIGVLDADLKSPTCARMLGATGPIRITEDGAEPVTGIAGIRLFSTDLLLAEGKPLEWKEPSNEQFIWRGTLEAGALREFLGDVVWGNLDLLLVDLPPGADRVSDLALLVPELTGAIAVTIPSEESRRSVERSIQAALDAHVRLIGIVENMSGYECGGCGLHGPLFTGDAGNTLASAFGVPLLGKFPFAQPGSRTRDSAAVPVVQSLLKAIQ